jgi:hypothetical protein
MSEKKPCVLEGTAPGATAAGSERPEEGAASHPPCALCCPDIQPAAPASGATAPTAPPEDESADPVGDGHSDAEWAARHPRDKPA